MPDAGSSQHPLPGSHAESNVDENARQVLAALGPRLAELVVAHEESNVPSAGDETNARELVDAFAGPADGLFLAPGTFSLEMLRCEARNLVVRYHAAILRVADVLERRAVLTGEQVAALVYRRRDTGSLLT